MTHIPLIPGNNLPAKSAPGGGMAQIAKKLARRHGFDLAGITPPDLHSAYDRYLEWINRGYAGEMGYLTRRPEVRKDLRNVWPDTQSALVVAMRYRPNESPEGNGSHRKSPSGKIARYAVGGDYHKFIKKRLIRVLRELKEIEPTVEGRTYVDTGPILERDLAVHCGIGWAGKNSLLLNRKLGSYFFIGTLLLNQRLPADPPMDKEHCGTCTLCITECPTNAIVAPNVIDSRRCISYLTIELRTPISRELRPLIGNHIFGCDICQEVCPWNDNTPIAAEPRFSPRSGTQSLNLHELLLLDEREFKNRFQGTPVMRAHYGGFLRNVAVAIGNTGDRTSIYPLSQALQHPEFLARGHAAWALGRIGSRTGLERIRQLLEARLCSENDEWVREEIELALGEMINTWNQPGNKVE